jgi:hypothetical protein
MRPKKHETTGSDDLFARGWIRLSAARGQDRLGLYRRRNRATIQRQRSAWNCYSICAYGTLANELVAGQEHVVHPWGRFQS